MFSFEDRTSGFDLRRGYEAIRPARVLKGVSRSLWSSTTENIFSGVSGVVSSDDSKIHQSHDRETDSVLTGPIVSFFTNDEAQMVLVAIERFRGQ